MRAAVAEVAGYLGNTPAMARASYIDPRVLDLYEAGNTIGDVARRRFSDRDRRQAALERALLALLGVGTDTGG